MCVYMTLINERGAFFFFSELNFLITKTCLQSLCILIDYHTQDGTKGRPLQKMFQACFMLASSISDDATNFKRDSATVKDEKG